MDIRSLDWCFLDKNNSSARVDGFSRALAVWINKPHVVNRRLCGTQIIYSNVSELRHDSLKFSVFLDSVFTKYSSMCFETKSDNHMPISETSKESIETIEEHDSSSAEISVDIENLDAVDKDLTVVVVRDLHPKQIDRYPILREVVVYDISQQTIIFYPLCKRLAIGVNSCHVCSLDEDIAYRFCFQNGSISLDYCTKSFTNSSILPCKSQSHVTPEWLKEHLLTKLCRWSEEEKLRTGVTSLKLVPVDKYTAKYHQLKQKYGANLVKIWPERTDPSKFVYEDIAIATYLLLIWEKEREGLDETKMQSFVDLGCGNGLLVYILSKEGHPGLGIDVRRRKIWDMFGSDINLQEKSITPSSSNLFPEYDWLIGNHSDELTPWIPVIAARSSYRTCYFVLPCCHHDFDSKFSKKMSGVSQYRTYLDFVNEIGLVCGFEVEEDVLRIPSTKRVCFIGKTRIYPENEEADVDRRREEYIESRCKKHTQTVERSHLSGESGEGREGNASSQIDDKEPVTKKVRLEHAISDPHACADNVSGTQKAVSWASNFQPRASKERVQNCMDVDQCTRETIVRTVFNKVLQAEDAAVTTLEDGKTWHKGGSIPLPIVASFFDGDLLKKLKNECGGIQTLLRNQHNVFEVSKGCVKLRYLSSSDPGVMKNKKNRPKSDKTLFLKTVLCWFHDNHPDGCPRSAASCAFAHGHSELKDKPRLVGKS